MGYLQFIPEDPGKLKDFLEKKADKLSEAFRKGFNKGAQFFIAELVEKSFTGRPGLNRVSGHAAGGWRHSTEAINGSGGTVDINHRVFQIYKYVKYHDKGFDGAPNIPKRINVKGFFKTEGKKIYRQEISDAIKGMN
jgi:hypothetical protein